MRKYLVTANWKMNGSKQQVANLLPDLVSRLKDLGTKIDCVICPPSVYLDQSSLLTKSTNIQLGAQNVASSEISAFTGEISPQMLREFGCSYAIIGHSERRVLLQETDALIAAKFQVALAAGLKPILCVGESQAQMTAGRSWEVVAQQLQVVLQQVGISAFKDAVIAYEPVWAIGTGLTATPQQAQAMHAQIRGKLAALDPEIAAAVRIIYGGSVKGNNAAELFKESDIDGGLIGGASLQAQDFSDICHAALRMAE